MCFIPLYNIYSKHIFFVITTSVLRRKCKQKHKTNISLPDFNKNWNILTSFSKILNTTFYYNSLGIYRVDVLLTEREKDVAKQRDAFSNFLLRLRQKSWTNIYTSAGFEPVIHRFQMVYMKSYCKEIQTEGRRSNTSCGPHR